MEEEVEMKETDIDTDEWKNNNSISNDYDSDVDENA